MGSEPPKPGQVLLGSHSPLCFPPIPALGCHCQVTGSVPSSPAGLGVPSGSVSALTRHSAEHQVLVSVSHRGMAGGGGGGVARAGCGVLTVVRRRRELNLSSQAAAALRKASCLRISCSTSSTLLPSSRLCRSGSWAVSQASATTASWANWCTSSTEGRHWGSEGWGRLWGLHRARAVFSDPLHPLASCIPALTTLGSARMRGPGGLSEGTSFSSR